MAQGKDSTSDLETEPTLDEVESVVEHARKLTQAACTVLAPHELPASGRVAMVALELAMYLLTACVQSPTDGLDDPAVRDALHIFHRLSTEMRLVVRDAQ